MHSLWLVSDPAVQKIEFHTLTLHRSAADQADDMGNIYPRVIDHFLKDWEKCHWQFEWGMNGDDVNGFAIPSPIPIGMAKVGVPDLVLDVVTGCIERIWVNAGEAEIDAHDRNSVRQGFAVKHYGFLGGAAGCHAAPQLRDGG